VATFLAAVGILGAVVSLVFLIVFVCNWLSPPYRYSNDKRVEINTEWYQRAKSSIPKVGLLLVGFVVLTVLAIARIDGVNG
jgi:hypothetical protein